MLYGWYELVISGFKGSTISSYLQNYVYVIGQPYSLVSKQQSPTCCAPPVYTKRAKNSSPKNVRKIKQKFREAKFIRNGDDLIKSRVTYK